MECYELLMLFLHAMGLQNHPASVSLAQRASELNSRSLGEVTQDQALDSIQRQDQPERALRISMLSFVRVEALFVHIKQALTQALANCRVITRDTDLDGKKLLSSIDQVLP